MWDIRGGLSFDTFVVVRVLDYLSCDPPSLDTIGSRSFSLSQVGENVRCDTVVYGISQNIE